MCLLILHYSMALNIVIFCNYILPLYIHLPFIFLLNHWKIPQILLRWYEMISMLWLVLLLQRFDNAITMKTRFISKNCIKCTVLHINVNIHYEHINFSTKFIDRLRCKDHFANTSIVRRLLQIIVDLDIQYKIWHDLRHMTIYWHDLIRFYLIQC